LTVNDNTYYKLDWSTVGELSASYVIGEIIR